MDRIVLRGLRAVGVHGVLPEERERAQPFEVDLDVEADLSIAGRSDDLHDTLDYGAITETVAAVIGGPPCALLERLAERVADAVLATQARAAVVTVTVWKLRPPVPLQLERAGVTITRARAT